jgi:hypothetical protein
MVMMQQWVIYDHPADFPEHYVVRCWIIGAGEWWHTGEAWLRPDLESAREVIAGNYPDGYRLDRQPEDDPVVVEVWI